MRLPNRLTRRPARTASLADFAFEHYHAGLQRFLVRRLRSAQTAQDLAQEAYLRLLRLDRGEFVRKPQAYLYRIASNLVYEYRLRERNAPVTFDSEALERAAEHPAVDLAEGADAGDQLDMARQIDDLLEPLPPLYRAILLLRKRDGLSYPEIAQTLGISVHTVKKYLARAVAQCRELRGGPP